MNDQLPKSVVATLWSYDTNKLETERDKDLIITSVLNYGTWEAVEWVRGTYAPGQIREAIAATPTSSWSKKSHSLWSSVYDVATMSDTRFA